METPAKNAKTNLYFKNTFYVPIFEAYFVIEFSLKL